MTAALDLNPSDVDRYLEFAVSCERDPVRWIENAYPWGVRGTILENAVPHQWHLEIADDIRSELDAIHRGEKPEMSIDIGIASGHGVGKSAFMGMADDWNLSTMPNSRGITTANTQEQLANKTWAEQAKWHQLSISQPFFTWTATQLVSTEPGRQKSWVSHAVPWNERRPESFQGLHNKGRRILVKFDEGSAIPRVIYDAIEGAKTDEGTQIIHLVFGNPTRNSGPFYELFGKRKKYWITRQIDSRDVPGTNKHQIQKWIDEHGEDSDFVRIRVKGVFPRQSAEQFIPNDWVEEAMSREGRSLADDPLVCGIDFARSGSCASVLYWRRGKDGKSIKPDIYHDDPDSEVFIAKCAQRLKDMRPDIIMGDADGLGGPLVDRLAGLGFPIIGINSGSSSEFPDQNRNKRADLWYKGKRWIEQGGALWDDEQFRSELTVMEVVQDTKKGLLQMESKMSLLARGEASPDIADAFMLTHAFETTELLSIEHLNDMRVDTVRDDFEQYPSEDTVMDDGDPEYAQSRDWRDRMRYMSDSRRDDTF